MSGTQHTSGKLQINHADPLQICDTDGEVRGCAPVARMAEFGSVSERRANARRLVAAWNAFEGLDTELIESMVNVPEFFFKQIGLLAQRDELLSGLSSLVTSLADSDNEGLIEHAPQMQAARALLATHSKKDVALIAEQARIEPTSLTDEQLRDEVRRRVESSGLTQENYAMGHGYSPQYLSDFLNGKRKPGPAILEGENMACVTRYVNLNCVPIGPEMLRSALPQTHKSEDAPSVVREFQNEIGNHIKITIEGPTSTSENTLTPIEATELSRALIEHSATAILAEVAALKAQRDELLAGLIAAFPRGFVANANIPGDVVVPVDFTMAELRAMAALIAKHKGAV